MRLDEDLRYDSPPADVLAMLADPAFQELVCERSGSLSWDVDVSAQPEGGVRITTRRTLPTDEVPDVARRFVGDTLDVRRVDVWEPPAPDGSAHGTAVVELVGAPIRMTATLALRAEGGGAVEELRGDLRAGVPLIGGKLEKAAEPAVRAALRKEQQVGTRWLAGES